MLEQSLFRDDGRPTIRTDHWSLSTVHGTSFPVHGTLFAVITEPAYSIPTMLPGKPMSVMRLPLKVERMQESEMSTFQKLRKEERKTAKT